MGKYRTVEKNGKFYPQKRDFFFLWDYYEERFRENIPDFLTIEVCFKTLKESEDFISQQILKKKYAEAVKKTTKIHKFAN